MELPKPIFQKNLNFQKFGVLAERKHENDPILRNFISVVEIIKQYKTQKTKEAFNNLSDICLGQ